jgi:capsule biosynthesis phosphatase
VTGWQARLGQWFIRVGEALLQSSHPLLPAQPRRALTLVFDIDGVLADTPADRDYSNSLPFEIARIRLWELKSRGHRIVLLTARGMVRWDGNAQKAEEMNWLQTRCWLQNHAFPFDELRFGKPSGEVYVDDRAFRVESGRGVRDWDNLFAHIQSLGG